MEFFLYPTDSEEVDANSQNVEHEEKSEGTASAEEPEETSQTAEAEDPATKMEEEPSEPKTVEDVCLNTPITDTTSAVVSCSIDGNLELAQAPTTLPTGPKRIKINISKPIVAKQSENGNETPDKIVQKDDAEEAPCSSEPAPPGEEPLVLKPKLIGRKLTELPPKSKGTETSGLCSIM